MKDSFYSGKQILVTGGTGMIGAPLVKLLRERNAGVRVASLDEPVNLPQDVTFLQLDLTQEEACRQACRGMDYVFHLAGIKGGVGIGRSQAAKFFEGNALINLQMLRAARESGVQKYLFTSTIGVYPDVPLFKEDEVWDKPPHPSDWYGAWSKRFGELQCEAYREQYGFSSVIVRPANVYGPYDNFNPETAMVIPALIARAGRGENPLIVWGDGSPVRDFIYSEDCALGMVLALEKAGDSGPINLGSGVGVSIKEVAEAISRYAPSKPKIQWDTSKPAGNQTRLMDVSKARKVLGFTPRFTFEKGMEATMAWYRANPQHQASRYSIFSSQEASVKLAPGSTRTKSEGDKKSGAAA